MAFKNLIAFGAGEITPELAERGNLEKFRTGLKRLRNAMVTKMGGLVNRGGTVKSTTGIDAYQTMYHTVANRTILFEFKKTHFLIHKNFNNLTLKYDTFDLVTYPTPFGAISGAFSYTEAQLKILTFTNNDTHLFVFCKGKLTLEIDLNTFAVQVIQKYAPTINQYTIRSSTFLDTTGATTSPAGYDVEYFLTYVKDGIESVIVSNVLYVSTANGKLPIGTGQFNNLYVNFPSHEPPGYTVPATLPDEIRFYRRPKQAGAMGFVGSAFASYIPNGANPPGFWNYKMIDFGQDADYSNQPPDFVSGIVKDTGTFFLDLSETASFMLPHTGMIYQSRLMIPGVKTKNLVFGSRTDAPRVFLRDFPLQDDSAVALKTGSDGGAEVGRFFDGRGLLISTNVGVFETPSDVLTPDTAFAIKRSGVVHDPTLPMLGSGKGDSVFTYDNRNEAVFTLKPAGDSLNFLTSEISIFSAHLFEGRRPVSWTLQDDGGQILWLAMNDGKLLSLAFQEDQQLMAWSWHDTDGKVKQVMTLKQPGLKDILLLAVERTNDLSGTVIAVEALSNRKANFLDYVGADHAVIFKNQMVPSGQTVTLTPTVPGDWSEVTITYSTPGTPIWSNAAGLGAVGSVFRFFNETTRMAVDYKVTSYLTGPVRLVCDLVTTQEPDEALGQTGVSSLILNHMYQTWNVLQGLGTLEGKKVSIRMDGFTHASPLNTDPNKNYPVYTVSGAQVTLNDGERGAIISVGLPYATDIQTLEIDTIEQSPVKLDSQIANKIHLSYYNSRAVYAKGSFPEDDTVTGMENHERQIEPEEGIDPMIPPPPFTSREEMVIEGEWAANGSIALRNVDPQPIGIRAIILDEEILRS